MGGISPEIQSVSAAIQNMLLKAHSMGLGSLWINDVLFAEPAILDFLKFKKTESEFKSMFLDFGKKMGIDVGFSGPLVGAVALGYPNEVPKREPRYSIDEITTWYK